MGFWLKSLKLHENYGMHGYIRLGEGTNEYTGCINMVHRDNGMYCFLAVSSYNLVNYSSGSGIGICNLRWSALINYRSTLCLFTFLFVCYSVTVRAGVYIV